MLSLAEALQVGSRGKNWNSLLVAFSTFNKRNLYTLNEVFSPGTGLKSIWKICTMSASTRRIELQNIIIR